MPFFQVWKVTGNKASLIFFFLRGRCKGQNVPGKPMPQASGSPFTPAGQPCSVTDCSAACIKTPRGEAPTRATDSNLILQAIEPHPAATVVLCRGRGTRRLRYPTCSRPPAKHQQGKHTPTTLHTSFRILKTNMSSFQCANDNNTDVFLALISRPDTRTPSLLTHFSAGVLYLLVKQVLDKSEQDAPVLHECCCEGD